MRNLLVLNLIVFALIFSGCADVRVPNTEQLITEPLGDSACKVGMSVDKVVSILGEPDMKSTVYSDDWKGGREEWVYSAQYSGLPVNIDYLSEDLYLYFDGVNLTNISKKPMGAVKHIQKDTDDFIK